MRKWQSRMKFPIHVRMAVSPFPHEKVPLCTSIYHTRTLRNRDWGMKRSWKPGRWAISVVAVYRDIPVSFRPYCIYTRRDGNFVFPTRSCTFAAFLCPFPDGNANSLTSIIRPLPWGLKFCYMAYEIASNKLLITTVHTNIPICSRNVYFLMLSLLRSGAFLAIFTRCIIYSLIHFCLIFQALFKLYQKCFIYRG